MSDAGASPPPSWSRRLGDTIWWFFNTPIGVWLLTSAVVGFIVWQYQNWQQEIQERAERIQKVEMLNLEIAARMSQFGTWARRNLFSNQKYEFKPEVTEDRVINSIREISKAPAKETAIPFSEMFPENRTRNLLSLYGELAHLAQEQITRRDVNIDILRTKIAMYRFAETALIDPTLLFGYQGISHDVFICQFQRIFLTDDISKSGLPSSDCLENKREGSQACITYLPNIECNSLRKNAG